MQRDGKEGQVRSAIERERKMGCSSRDAQKSDEELAELMDQRERAQAEVEKKRKHEEFLASEELAKHLQEVDHALAASASDSKRLKKVSSRRFMHLVASHQCDFKFAEVTRREPCHVTTQMSLPATMCVNNERTYARIDR